MATNIAVSADAVQLLLRRFRSLADDSGSLGTQAKLAINEAENMGWKDQAFFRFRDDAEEILRKYTDAVREVEEILIPTLSQLNNSIEHF